MGSRMPRSVLCCGAYSGWSAATGHHEVDRTMRHRVEHGCGHFWLIATIHWDFYDEVVESWCYWPNSK